MDRKPGDNRPPGSNGGGKNKEAGQPAFTPHYLQPSPATVSVDASAFELLSRGASEEEARVLRRFLTEWSRGDEDTFPFQFTLLTRAYLRAAASVPVQMAKVLQQHQSTTDDGARRIAQAADAKVAEFGQIGQIVEECRAVVAGIRAEGAHALAELKASTAALREAEQRAKKAERSNDLWILSSAFLLIAALGIALGFLTCRYMAHTGWTMR